MLKKPELLVDACRARGYSFANRSLLMILPHMPRLPHMAVMPFAVALCFVLCGPLAAAEAPVAPHHMIAAANPFAAEAGREMLRAGGSSVDAAIAAQAVLTLVEPESSGIGGGAFLMLWDPAQKKVTSFDGRETAPASARPGMFLDAAGKPRPHGEAIPGGLSVGTPGVLAMLYMAHEKYGRLPWAKLFEPAIRLSQDGFPVGRKLARTLRAVPQALWSPEVKAYFTKADGQVVGEGDILKNPELAATLRLIARGGPAVFYQGPLASAMADKVQQAPRNPGGLSVADLAAYHAVERAPVCAPYRVWRICSMAPPSSGGIAVVQILAMLERFSVADLQPGTLKGVHLFAQASRLAFADRAAYLGDPAFVNIPMAGLLDRHYLADRSRLIDPARDMGQAVAGTPPGAPAVLVPQHINEVGGTSHMSIVDDRGVAVAMTTTVESYFGAQMMVGGFFLNNQLTDFSFDPLRDGKPAANAPAPGKRPLSSMSPTLVFDARGHFLLAVGSPGGPAIIPYVSGALLALLDGRMNPAAAAALPHVVEMNGPLLLEKDDGLSSLVPALEAMGYAVKASASEVSGLHIVEKVKGGYRGAADPRRDGVAVGD